MADVPAGASPGSHGYLNSDPDMRAIFIAWGAGIEPGREAWRDREPVGRTDSGAVAGPRDEGCDGQAARRHPSLVSTTARALRGRWLELLFEEVGGSRD